MNRGLLATWTPRERVCYANKTKTTLTILHHRDEPISIKNWRYQQQQQHLAVLHNRGRNYQAACRIARPREETGHGVTPGNNNNAATAAAETTRDTTDSINTTFVRVGHAGPRIHSKPPAASGQWPGNSDSDATRHCGGHGRTAPHV
ncbi:unnamed protein product [Lampetra fluviatilis]